MHFYSLYSYDILQLDLRLYEKGVGFLLFYSFHSMNRHMQFPAIYRQDRGNIMTYPFMTKNKRISCKPLQCQPVGSNNVLVNIFTKLPFDECYLIECCVLL